MLSEIQQYSKSLLSADFLPMLFGKYVTKALASDIPIVLFGAGSAGKELFECLCLFKIDVSCFCDNNPDLIGKSLLERPIISRKKLMLSHKNSLIIISSNNYKYEIKEMLEENGFTHICYIEDDKQFFYYLQIYKWHYPLSSLTNDSQKLTQAYQLLSDEKSRRLFKKRLNLLTSYPDYGLFQEYLSEFGTEVELAKKTSFQVSTVTDNYESYLYFNNDVLTIEQGDVLIDAGAFDGDSTIEFITTCKSNSVEYGHVYCVEADDHNFTKLVSNMKAFDRITCLPVGLWSKTTQLKFATSNSMFVTESRVVDETIKMNHVQNVTKGDHIINTVSIDEQFSGEKVSFIKMDIEGSEIEALLGAKETIKANRPKLAISIYHKKSDLYEIPLLISQLCPEYKLYLRHFSHQLSETVLLATV